MDKTTLERLKNKHTSLKKNDGFIIDGYLESVDDDSIVFLADNKLRIIKFTEIAEIRELGQGWRK
ncbi:MAG: hypothetical protein MUO82_07755 [Candidatus Thermoplasmatota archaeon]|nr:hypothetical protein [Candidatus Thermoplasmatota archaeon]